MSAGKSPSQLAEKLSNLPAQPGVYLYKNSDGKVLYVGKAKNLRTRVRSYFQDGRRPDPKTARMVAQIAELETNTTVLLHESKEDA